MSIPLRYSHYRFALRTRSRVTLGAFPASTIRGAIGGALREVSCTTGATVCNGCPLIASCAYAQLFEAAPLPGSLHEGFADAPRPYVIHLPRRLPSHLKSDTGVAFEIVLVESAAAAALPALVRAVERLETTGLGDNRERGEGHFQFKRVEALHVAAPAPVWTSGRRSTNPLPAPARLGSTPCPDAPEASLRVIFDTPVRLRSGGQTHDRLSLEDLVRALTRRVRALAALHGRLDATFQQQLHDWIDLSRWLEVREARFQPAVHRRYSARQGQQVPLEGVLGSLTIKHGWQLLWPLLDAGRLLHVGKNATHGLGQYHVEIVYIPRLTPA